MLADTVAGWYYAEAKFGDELAVAGVCDTVPAQIADVVATLGGVRVVDFKETTFKVDNGVTKIDSVPGPGETKTPTNIKITKDGVIYSQIPNTLTFRDVITIDADAVDPGSDPGLETFLSSGDAVPYKTAGPGGPGDAASPTDNTTSPSVGDFYVIEMAGGTPLTSKRLAWRSVSGITITNDGSNPVVENGDLVAWGGAAWVVIGTVNTDTVAQDLQATTARGDTTTVGITLTSGSNLTAVTDASDIQLGPAGVGDGKKNVLSVGSIDFGRFPVLPPTP